MITVRYKCRCMAMERSLAVVDRGQDEDLMDWMTKVQMALGADHQLISPNCISGTVEYLKIPHDEDNPSVGMKPHLSS